jgi:hypothetical protein
MIKFFRKIRQNLLSEGKTGKYLKYAFGEIILVVIGILIALQINNSNQERILRGEEETVLISLKKDLIISIENIDNVIKEKRTVIEIDDYLLKFTGPNPKWDSKVNFDSIMYYVTVSGWMHFPAEGTMSDILNSGKLSLIKNDSIRSLISTLPLQMQWTREEERNYRIDLHEYFLPYLGKKYPIRQSTKYRQLYKYTSSNLKTSKFEIFPEQLLSDIEFENILTIQSIWLKFTIDMLETQKLIYEDIVKLIDKELNK